MTARTASTSRQSLAWSDSVGMSNYPRVSEKAGGISGFGCPARHHRIQIAGAQWFGNVIAHARGKALFAISRHHVRRHGDDGDGLPPGTNLAGCFVAVQFGHPAIH